MLARSRAGVFPAPGTDSGTKMGGKPHPRRVSPRVLATGSGSPRRAMALPALSTRRTRAPRNLGSRRPPRRRWSGTHASPSRRAGSCCRTRRTRGRGSHRSLPRCERRDRRLARRDPTTFRGALSSASAAGRAGAAGSPSPTSRRHAGARRARRQFGRAAPERIGGTYKPTLKVVERLREFVQARRALIVALMELAEVAPRADEEDPCAVGVLFEQYGDAANQLRGTERVTMMPTGRLSYVTTVRAASSGRSSTPTRRDVR